MEPVIRGVMDADLGDLQEFQANGAALRLRQLGPPSQGSQGLQPQLIGAQRLGAGAIGEESELLFLG